MADKICIITGAGDGTGASCARRFTRGGYRVALLARTEARLRRLEAELDGARGYVCDVSDLDALRAACTRVTAEMGAPSAAIHNAAAGGFKPTLEADPARLEGNFRVNTTALMVFAQCVVPAMIEAGSGALIVTGNTSAWRGRPRFATFAPTKAAQRILTQSMARDFGPHGVHVAYVTIDAAIDTPWTRPRFAADKPDEHFCKPDAIADTIFHIAHQDRSGWTFDVDLRPFGENW